MFKLPINDSCKTVTTTVITADTQCRMLLPTVEYDAEHGQGANIFKVGTALHHAVAYCMDAEHVLDTGV